MEPEVVDKSTVVEEALVVNSGQLICLKCGFPVKIDPTKLNEDNICFCSVCQMPYRVDTKKKNASPGIGACTPEKNDPLVIDDQVFFANEKCPYCNAKLESGPHCGGIDIVCQKCKMVFHWCKDGNPKQSPPSKLDCELCCPQEDQFSNLRLVSRALNTKQDLHPPLMSSAKHNTSPVMTSINPCSISRCFTTSDTCDLECCPNCKCPANQALFDLKDNGIHSKSALCTNCGVSSHLCDNDTLVIGEHNEHCKHVTRNTKEIPILKECFLCGNPLSESRCLYYTTDNTFKAVPKENKPKLCTKCNVYYLPSQNI